MSVSARLGLQALGISKRRSSLSTPRPSTHSLRKDAKEVLGKGIQTDAERLKKAAEQAEAAAKEAATRAELARKKLLEQDEHVNSFS